jgi:bacteriocin-like protein
MSLGGFMELTNKELKQIVGGAVTAAFINAIARGINTFLDLGRSVGTAIRRIGTGKICSL